MQSVSSRIWTHVAVSISHDDNHYTTGTSKQSQFDIRHLFEHLACSIWSIGRTLSSATTPDQSGPGSNEGVLNIPQISKVGALPSDGLMSYPGHSLNRWSYPLAEKQSAYSTATADWAVDILKCIIWSEKLKKYIFLFTGNIKIKW